MDNDFFIISFIIIVIQSAMAVSQVGSGRCYCRSEVMNPTGIHEDSGSIPGLTQQAKDLALLGAVV